MIQLNTDRLLLRNYREEDIPFVFGYFSKEEVARFEDFHPMTLDEVKEEITEWISMDNRLVVERKEDRQIVGSVGYWVDEDGDYSIDFDFDPRFKKRGYATEAAAELLRFLFEEKGIPVIYGDCDVRNVNSYRLLERLGFQRIKQLDNQSYKDDKEGHPILISVFLYRKGNL